MQATLDHLCQVERRFGEAYDASSRDLELLQEVRRKIALPMPTAWHQVAVWVVAPVLAGFAGWIKSHGTCPLLGVMREGRFLGRLMQELYGRPARDVWLNRDLAMRAAFGCGDDEALVNWLLRTRLVPLTQGEALQKLVGREDTSQEADRIVDHDGIDRLIKAWTENGWMDTARQHASQLADRLLRHWQAACMDITPDEAIGMMDFASVGNIQRSLQTIFAARGLPAKLIGLNFSMTKGAVWAERKGCVMRGYLAERGEPAWFADATARTPELMEIFTAELMGPLVDYGENGEPVIGACFLSTPQAELLRDVQRCLLDAARFYSEALGANLTADLGRCLWGRLLLQPFGCEVEAMAAWPLDAGLEGRAQRVLAAPLAESDPPWTKGQTAWPAGSRVLAAR